ncbi:MAG TPA: hypothetical protein VHD88_04035 [Pyrinomonadaceae bacterium]|nr:hypothetical protein [Pyrinomonadaceae bacterium]
MGELDEAWELALAEAAQRARTAGRADIADYLDLRAQNDLLRRTAIDWLTNTVISLAADANRGGAGIQIEQKDAHSFRRGHATMVGPQLTLRSGVRALTIESGWPRTPRDGFVRGGGLACADIKHFGRQRSNAELLLALSSSGAPQWLLLEQTGATPLFTEAQIRKHFSVLLTES